MIPRRFVGGCLGRGDPSNSNRAASVVEQVVVLVDGRSIVIASAKHVRVYDDDFIDEILIDIKMLLV